MGSRNHDPPTRHTGEELQHEERNYLRSRSLVTIATLAVAIVVPASQGERRHQRPEQCPAPGSAGFRRRQHRHRRRLRGVHRHERHRLHRQSRRRHDGDPLRQLGARRRSHRECHHSRSRRLRAGARRALADGRGRIHRIEVCLGGGRATPRRRRCSGSNSCRSQVRTASDCRTSTRCTPGSESTTRAGCSACGTQMSAAPETRPIITARTTRATTASAATSRTPTVSATMATTSQPKPRTAGPRHAPAATPEPNPRQRTGVTELGPSPLRDAGPRVAATRRARRLLPDPAGYCESSGRTARSRSLPQITHPRTTASWYPRTPAPRRSRL